MYNTPNLTEVSNKTIELQLESIIKLINYFDNNTYPITNKLLRKILDILSDYKLTLTNEDMQQISQIISAYEDEKADTEKHTISAQLAATYRNKNKDRNKLVNKITNNLSKRPIISPKPKLIPSVFPLKFTSTQYVFPPKSTSPPSVIPIEHSRITNGMNNKIFTIVLLTLICSVSIVVYLSLIKESFYDINHIDITPIIIIIIIILIKLCHSYFF